MTFDSGAASRTEPRLQSVRGVDPGSPSPAPPAVEDDSWFEWLRAARYGGDAAYAATLQPQIDDIRDRLLDHANLRPGQAIADIGCGDGLAGFGAVDREPTSTVTFVDISSALIVHCREAAERRGIAERCRFLIAPAEALEAIPSASIDVVLVRAVLAYVRDKAAAIGEFRRILRPGGRVSIVDPIFADRAFAVAGIASQVGTQAGPAARYIELLHRCRSAQFPDSLDAIAASPLTNYNERDLLRLFETAGFVNNRLRLHIDSIPALPMPWPAFLASSPHAGAATIGAILEARFSPEERLEFEAFFRPNIEAGTSLERNVNAYLYADKP